MNAARVSFGAKILASIAARAAYAAAAGAVALDAPSARTRDPRCTARVAAAAKPRAAIELDGFVDSSFTNRRSRPRARPRRRARTSGVQPSPRLTGWSRPLSPSRSGRISLYRQSDDSRPASDDFGHFSRPLGHTGPAGSAARAQMMKVAWVVRPGPAWYRALKMGKKCGHVYFPRRSASFFFCKSSMAVTCWSVIVCTSSSARRSSSSEIL